MHGEGRRPGVRTVLFFEIFSLCSDIRLTPAAVCSVFLLFWLVSRDHMSPPEHTSRVAYSYLPPLPESIPSDRLQDMGLELRRRIPVYPTCNMDLQECGQDPIPPVSRDVHRH